MGVKGERQGLTGARGSGVEAVECFPSAWPSLDTSPHVPYSPREKNVPVAGARSIFLGCQRAGQEAAAEMALMRIWLDAE